MIDKAEVTGALFEEWATIEAVIGQLDESQWRLPTCLPNWNVHAVVAHLIGTESFLAGIQPPDSGVDVKELPHVHNPIGELNERWVIGLHDLSGAEMVERFSSITAQRRQALSAMPQAEWEKESLSPLGQVPYGRFMRLRIFDCWMHELDIRDAVGLPGDEGGRRGELAFLDIQEALGFVVGKRGKAPDGGRISLELTGPLARTIAISVDGRARVVDQFDDGPTTVIRLDSGLFVRLCGGRTTAADHVAAIELEGDTEVGRRIVDNLAFVF
ncbi:maleylpyruvate isomerase family mycothiol-dependent enzyme [Antrihabitans sp. YC2-6]|uniref:maleylpyruvate isomerase family mycothiol-dependent enzyme n=1 Tax=Antrihabitans sp. YC2-6 TaxID=2799498 RepID=UPI0018F2E0A1|nr:maleylpyruvate isomerase family mycothiol-dependent enzyme [Antrihabitans sp. YC2-6]MBJ8348090.1 maleylpyruvate isomerase family mycothiol-dependent enzyme [Antrihabitans sp. YC2-6]